MGRWNLAIYFRLLYFLAVEQFFFFFFWCWTCIIIGKEPREFLYSFEFSGGQKKKKKREKMIKKEEEEEEDMRKKKSHKMLRPRINGRKMLTIRQRNKETGETGWGPLGPYTFDADRVKGWPRLPSSRLPSTLSLSITSLFPPVFPTNVTLLITFSY